jgi:hypothetical protein
VRRPLALLAGLALLVACTTSPPVTGGWREVPLPAPGARILAMAAAGDRLLVLGSVPGPDGRAPAAWTTTDGQAWRPVALEPHSAYAFQAELASVGVAGDQVVVLGQAFGGAHGNPRPTVWSGGTDRLVEHPQNFELFGGPHAIAVNEMAAIPGTELLAGQWDGTSGRYGAAVWTSPDGTTWTRQADDPALASAVGEQTSAIGAAAGPAGFLVAGSTQRGARIVPLAWTSPDGRSWRRAGVPADGSATANRAACDSAGCVLLGIALGAPWHALCWPVTETVGDSRAGPQGSTVDVSQALLRGPRVYATLRIDDAARLASINRDCTDWQDIPLPVSAREARIGALPDGLLLATTDATASRLWLQRS